MTAAWGGLGFLWNRPLAIIFIRPQRYTYEFVERYDSFSLSFFNGGEKKALNLCGTRSGREIDKMKETGLTPKVSKTGNIYYEQASLVIDCKKVYYDDIDPARFLDPGISRNYPQKDYHRMYFGFITHCLVKV